MLGISKNPNIETAEPIIYISPTVDSLAKSDRKLEFEYIGIAKCRVYIKPMIAIVYI
jgi:hypothetical protein